ncbi:hypothetical protein BCV70DRAFT_201168 [Testicularia cyperi]|uniref:Uncharacterized protein n=1 Tax=Testicularia cyperi TaxID=1882483 RepID=A0A317XLL0_9BASI|nr:hypothetical protein BCV70DRAFT_201168 [Testicularia cyperi]
MSIRFHRGPSIITLFHDSSSSTSKQVLELLSSYRAGGRRGALPSASSGPGISGSHGESDVVEAANDVASGTEYLRQAASDPSGSRIELEVVDRKLNPPTPDQMRSIIDYLTVDPNANTSANAASDSKATYTPSGFNLQEHNRRKMALQQHLAKSGADGSSTSGMPKIKDGPIVINWDDGYATTSLEGVRDMLRRLDEQQSASHNDSTSRSTNTGSGCLIC